LAIVGLAGASGASAASKTGQFAVRAQVVNDCQLTTADLDFGQYTPTGASNATSPLNLKCTPGAAVTISLSAGSSGNPQARTMQSAGNNLGYQIYRDAGHTDPINTAGMAFQLSSAENTGQTVTYTLYGQAAAQQNVPAGGYVDTIQVTASY
jgi:spore coat protein U-like protein